MPTVLRADGFWFFFYANEGNEPANIHVRKAQGGRRSEVLAHAGRSLAWVRGLNPATITVLLALVRANRIFLLEKWNEFFAS